MGIVPAEGHHSISAHYHRGQTVRLEGTISRVHYRNPHASIELDVRSASGVERWVLEWDDVEDLAEAGITETSLSAGDHVIVDGNPSRDNRSRLFIRNLVRPQDGLQYVDD